MASCLQVENLTKSYGEQVLFENISFTIEEGRRVALVAKNGTGKTTLLNIIGGLDRYDSGDLIINGISTKKYTDRDWDSYRNHTIGFVFQSYNLIPHQTVLANVELALTISGISGAERKRRATEALQKVGLGNQLHKHPSEMSGGQKQRVAIAGVVAMRPDCLILDEATAMLDPRGREQVMQTIHYLNKNMGITVVSITHYMEEAAQADRVLVMSKGHVVMEGTPKEVFSQTEKVRSLRLDVPQAAELRDELVKAGIPLPEGIIDTGECAQALYELLK